MIIDQLRDLSGIHLYKILKKCPEIEGQIKEASFDEEEFNALPDTAFAWSEKRAFPIHTKEHATISMLYRTECDERVPSYVDEALTKAAEIYNIKPITTTTKVAAAPDTFESRIKTAQDLSDASASLLANKSTMSTLNRAKAATVMIKKADALGTSLDDSFYKWAGQTKADTHSLREWVEARVEATSNELYKRAYEKIANDLRTAPAVLSDRDDLIALTETLYDLDKKAGLIKFYDRKLPDPLHTVFNTTEKISARTIDLNGRQISLDKLAAHPIEFYSDILGDDLAKEASTNGEVDIEKLAMILGTLPRDLKATLVRQMCI